MERSCQAGVVRRLVADLVGDHVQGSQHVVGACGVRRLVADLVGDPVEGPEHVVGACSVPGLGLEISS